MATNEKIKKKRIEKDLKKKPEELKKPPVLASFRVDASSHSHVTCRADPEDSWSRDSSSSDWSVNGLSLTDKYGDVTADFDVQVGDLVYLVYAVYSTGDSFGRDENGCIDYITVHKDRDLALANAEALRNKTEYTDKKGNYDWNVNLRTDSGIVLPYHVPWLGYFESLTGVYVVPFLVKG